MFRPNKSTSLNNPRQPFGGEIKNNFIWALPKISFSMRVKIKNHPKGQPRILCWGPDQTRSGSVASSFEQIYIYIYIYV